MIYGEDREQTGTLLSIDGHDGVCQMDADDEIQVLNLKYLCKMKSRD